MREKNLAAINLRLSSSPHKLVGFLFTPASSRFHAFFSATEIKLGEDLLLLEESRVIMT